MNATAPPFRDMPAPLPRTPDPIAAVSCQLSSRAIALVPPALRDRRAILQARAGLRRLAAAAQQNPSPLLDHGQAAAPWLGAAHVADGRLDASNGGGAPPLRATPAAAGLAPCPAARRAAHLGPAGSGGPAGVSGAPGGLQPQRDRGRAVDATRLGARAAGGACERRRATAAAAALMHAAHRPRLQSRVPQVSRADGHP